MIDVAAKQLPMCGRSCFGLVAAGGAARADSSRCGRPAVGGKLALTPMAHRHILSGCHPAVGVRVSPEDARQWRRTCDGHDGGLAQPGPPCQAGGLYATVSNDSETSRPVYLLVSGATLIEAAYAARAKSPSSAQISATFSKPMMVARAGPSCNIATRPVVRGFADAADACRRDFAGLGGLGCCASCRARAAGIRPQS
jgi:hypothetical protein